ncbi:glycogen/starch/alpha-glucan phosphorylase [uncultured Desulfobacter sp.]|uniref:glycogen/starch/alpha-glucan phosphorylase n=1 Tax=uncultured Desulfobacter sp. TaxID=240139 RepID=UPI0029C69FC7|nr:glycogen/starch/alpha-glucan phosphorylase [uncultured Desulfobacter sp.]
MENQRRYPGKAPENIDQSATDLNEDIKHHIMTTMGNDFYPPRKDTYYNGLAYSVRDRLVTRWLNSQRSFYDRSAKRVYYLSLEFLPGRFLMNYVTNMQLNEACEKALEETDFTLEQLEEQEWDAGLGNGGLGRLASCYMDSMASLNIPGYGYGIMYDYGIFYQTIVNGYQVEQCDNWVRWGNPWEFKRRGFLYKVQFYGRSEPYINSAGKRCYRWVDTIDINAMACDILIPGYGTQNVNNMRLWAAMSSQEFSLHEFNQGDYIGAMESKVLTENISKVLYPSDEKDVGKELRLKQQYFFVAATFQDILRRFKKHNSDFNLLPERVAVQLNDTHPAIAVPELMRLLLDEEGLEWNFAWEISVKTFAYTNHTVLPEALEAWPVRLISKLLPRHMEIIYEINRRFLSMVEKQYPDKPELLRRVSIIEDGPEQRVRMAHLAIVGSHTVNGVAALHSRIIKEKLFKDFDIIFPGKIINVTNGVTPRRWVLQANPALSSLITDTIGPDWITDLDQLKKLIPHADNPEFREKWRQVKLRNKARLVKYIKRKVNTDVNPDTLFDVHVKRIHEYKRQLLNIFHVITLYNRIKKDPSKEIVPRTVIFGGKAAPSYAQAKLIIKLINSVADLVNNDPDVNHKLEVIFLPNYCVSQAEKIIPATDLSEQISTAGLEASGTGNMKFALNGALTIGTLDGANIEMMEEVGEDNIFIFGLTAKEVEKKRAQGYDPWHYYNSDEELRTTLDMVRLNHFIPEEPNLFLPIWDSLMALGDKYFVLADFRAFIQAQDKVRALYLDQEQWTRCSILNTANMGKFSSDRAVREYARDIWNIEISK